MVAWIAARAATIIGVQGDSAFGQRWCRECIDARDARRAAEASDAA
jgi:hypothetical protein